MKSAGDLCLPAFIGSRVAARPLVMHMFGHAETAGLASSEVLSKIYDDRTRDAIAVLKSGLPQEANDEIDRTISEGSDTAAARFRDFAAG